MSSSNALKRPAKDTTTGSTPPAKRRGRPKKSEDYAENEHARANAIWLKENCTPFDRADIDSHIGELFRAPGDGWTESLERAMNGMWQDGIYSKAKDRLAAAVQKKKGTTTPQLLNLWKICLRILKVTPVRLISFLELLEYHPDRAHLDVFSKQFCTALASLILHPAMEAKKQRIVICLQYAVLCRIDDRRIWPLSSSTSKCPVISAMIEVMKQAKDRKSDRPIHEVLVSCFLACEEKGEKPSDTANLLRQIGNAVSNSMPGPEVGDEMLVYRGRRVYPVSLHDLRIVIETLDVTPWEEESWRCTAQESYDSYISLNFRNSDIPHWSQLTEHYERAHKNTLRQWMLQTGFNPDDDGRSDSRESPGGSTYGEDHERGSETSLRARTEPQADFDGDEDQIGNEGHPEPDDLGHTDHDSLHQDSGERRSPPARSPVSLPNVSQSRPPIQHTYSFTEESPLIQVSSEKFKAMELHMKHLERKIQAFEAVLRPLQKSHKELQRRVRLFESGAFNNNCPRNGLAHPVPPQAEGNMDSNRDGRTEVTEPPDTDRLSAEHSKTPLETPPIQGPMLSKYTTTRSQPESEDAGLIEHTGVLSQGSANAKTILDVNEERRLAYHSAGLLDLGRAREMYQQRRYWCLPDPVTGCPVGIGRSKTHWIEQGHPGALNSMANSERVAQLVKLSTE